MWVAPAPLTEGAWRKGPRDALLVFLAYDGRTFLDQHAEAVVDLHLGEYDSGSPAWTIVALNVSDRSLVAVVIDTETGEVVSHAS